MAAKRSSTSLSQLLKLDPPPRQVLLVCEDAYRQRRASEKFFETHHRANSSSGDLEVHRIDCQKVSPATIRDLQIQLDSLSLFGSANAFEFHSVDKLNATRAKELLNLLKEVGQHNVIFLTASKLLASHPIAKYYKTQNVFVKLEELSGAELLKQTGALLKHHGIAKCPRAVLDLLVELADGSIDAIEGMVEHIRLYLDVSKDRPLDGPLSEKTLKELFLHFPDPSEYELIDALAAGNLARAEVLIRQLLRSGKNEFLLLHMLSRNFLQYFKVQVCTSARMPEGEIRQIVNLPPHIFRRVLQTARKYSVEHLTEIRRALFEMDNKLKGKALGPEILLSNLCSNLVAR